MTTPATYTDLQTAINDATSGDTLNITGECTGHVTVSSGTLSLTGMPTAALNGDNASTVLTVDAGANVTITNLLITGGYNPTGAAGGGIDNSGTVTLNGNTQVDHNSSSYFSGGILNHSTGTLTLNENAQVDDNSACQGAGIYDSGTVTLNDNAQVDGNSDCQGGGIYIDSGTVTLNDNAQVDHNTAGQGGGIWDAFNPVVVNLTGNAQVEGNTATDGPGNGGGIWSVGGGTVNSCEWTGAISPNSPDDAPTPTAYTGCTG